MQLKTLITQDFLGSDVNQMRAIYTSQLLEYFFKPHFLKNQTEAKSTEIGGKQRWIWRTEVMK